MKKRAFCVLICILLLAALLLAACGGGSRYKVLRGARLEDCTLTIYFLNGRIWWRISPTLEEILSEEDVGVSHVTVPGTELKENEQFLALLEMLDGQELPPVQYITNYCLTMRPLVYYALTDKNDVRLFDVGTCWDNFSDDDPGTTETVYFNGEKIPYDELFDLCVEPYMTYPRGED